jgi:hypothetical protein
MLKRSIGNKNTRLFIWVSGVFIALAAILVYWPGLSGPFVFDDYSNIVSNTKVHAKNLDLSSLVEAAKGYEPGQIGRPLATMSFAVNYYFSGENPWSYKLTSVIVHAVNALLVFLLLLGIMRIKALAENGRAIFCAAVTLAWAIHPLQVSTVLYVVQRMEMLSLTFVLVGLILYVAGRRRQIEGIGGMWLVFSSAIIAALGIAAKETAALFPLYTLALELTVLGFGAQGSRLRRFYKVSYLLACVTGVILFFVWVLPSAMGDDAFSNRSFTLAERLLTQFRVIPMYLGEIILPIPSQLKFYYDAYQKSTGLFSPISTALGAAFILGLMATAWMLRRKASIISLGILWFFSAHFLTSNVLNLELAFEHRNYFATLGVLLAVGDLIWRIKLRDGPALKYVAVIALLATIMGLSLIRSATWGNELLLRNELVDINPDSPRAGNDLAALLVAMANGDPTSPLYSMGKQQFERVASLPGASPLAEQGLILMAAVHGQPVEDAWWEAMIRKIKSQPLSPEQLMAVSGLLKQRYEGVQLDDKNLSRAYLALLDRKPDHAFLYAQFGGYALKYLNDESLADRMFVEAIDHSKNDRIYANIVLSGLLKDGYVRQAEKVFVRGSQLGLFDANEMPSGEALR